MLRADPFFIQDSQNIIAKVTAINAIGDSIVSSQGSGAVMPIADVAPDPPTSFVRIDESTTQTQVAFHWHAPANDGGDTVIDYAIEMDANNDNSYTEVATGVTAISYTQTGLTSGTSYKFKVRARNSVGFSVYSSVFTIVAATKPDEPTSFVRDESSTTKTQAAFSW